MSHCAGIQDAHTIDKLGPSPLPFPLWEAWSVVPLRNKVGARAAPCTDGGASARPQAAEPEDLETSDVDPAPRVPGRVAEVGPQATCTTRYHNRAGDLLPLATAGEGPNNRAVVEIVCKGSRAATFIPEAAMQELQVHRWARKDDGG